LCRPRPICLQGVHSTGRPVPSGGPPRPPAQAGSQQGALRTSNIAITTQHFRSSLKRALGGANSHVRNQVDSEKWYERGEECELGMITTDPFLSCSSFSSTWTQVRKSEGVRAFPLSPGPDRVVDAFGTCFRSTRFRGGVGLPRRRGAPAPGRGSRLPGCWDQNPVGKTGYPALGSGELEDIYCCPPAMAPPRRRSECPDSGWGGGKRGVTPTPFLRGLPVEM